ncbi:MAG TPA: ERAP1-like C-terminal domain-containing protein, partial [Acidobacteriaceae bacterium]
QRSLDYAASGKVRNQDAAIQFSVALQITGTRDRAWEYIKNNWDKVHAQFTTALGGYVVGSTGSFCSAGARDDVQKFFAEHKVGASGISLKHAIEKIDGCIELRKLQEPNLQKWLATQTKS